MNRGGKAPPHLRHIKGQPWRDISNSFIGNIPIL